MSIKEIIYDENKKSKEVIFTHYIKGFLWYKIDEDNGFEFPVPTEDAGDATFLARDKASIFMRYIRMHLSNIEKGKENES